MILCLLFTFTGYDCPLCAELCKLSIYTWDGRLEIDNNLVENAIRPMALGRKNYLFVGSHEAAQRAAMIYSLLGTCLKHQVNPFLWLRDVLTRLPDHPIQQIGELLPHRWKPTVTVPELEA